MKLHLAFAAALVLVSGCVPFPLQQTPLVSGHVVEASSGKPVSGAQLYYKEHPGQVIASAADGSFTFPSTSKWQLVPLGPYDRFGYNTLLIEAQGYQSSSKRVPIYAEEPYVVEVSLPVQP